MELSDWKQTPGTWRGTIMKPAQRFAQPAYDVVTKPFIDADQATLNCWLSKLRLPVEVGRQATPIDLIEAADALSLAAAVSFCDRVYRSALTAVRMIDPDFTLDYEGGGSLTYLLRAVEAILDDPALFGMVGRCMKVFDLDDRQDVAMFIAAEDYTDNSAYQRSYAHLCLALHQLMTTETDEPNDDE